MVQQIKPTMGPTAKVIAALKGDKSINIKFGHRYFVCLVYQRKMEREGTRDFLSRTRWNTQAIFVAPLPPEVEASFTGILTKLIDEDPVNITKTLNQWCDEVWNKLYAQSLGL